MTEIQEYIDRADYLDLDWIDNVEVRVLRDAKAEITTLKRELLAHKENEGEGNTSVEDDWRLTMRTVKWGYLEGQTITLEELQEQVGEGWAHLIERCFDACVEHDVHVVPVKEKFGGLRFYMGGAPKEVHDIIDECEHLSYKICEICGEAGKPRKGGWILTLCDKHYEEREAKRKKALGADDE